VADRVDGLLRASVDVIAHLVEQRRACACPMCSATAATVFDLACAWSSATWTVVSNRRMADLWVADLSHRRFLLTLTPSARPCRRLGAAPASRPARARRWLTARRGRR
jgi:hypothetical protein